MANRNQKLSKRDKDGGSGADPWDSFIDPGLIV